MEQQTLEEVLNVRALILRNKALGRPGSTDIPVERMARAIQAMREERMSAAPKAKGSGTKPTAEQIAQTDDLMEAFSKSLLSTPVKSET